MISNDQKLAGLDYIRLAADTCIFKEKYQRWDSFSGFFLFFFFFFYVLPHLATNLQKSAVMCNKKPG